MRLCTNKHRLLLKLVRFIDNLDNQCESVNAPIGTTCKDLELGTSLRVTRVLRA
jgi:hypothetical protein